MSQANPVWSTSGLQTVVYTEDNQPVELIRRLGAGGQGEVWEATGGRVAVKILHSRGQAAAALLAERLRTVRLLDLQGIPLARPLSLLKPPYLGYTMAMLADMSALRYLTAPTRRGDLAGWYNGTGGLRRRLRLLAGLAAGLSTLHGRGLCYGDPSPVNVMVSDPQEHEQVFLIDVDNIAVASEVRGGAYVTPGYAAPEVLAGRMGVSSLSDAFAFAIMAFETLTAQHPFIGDPVYDGEPELEQRAFAGELPWVDHSSDASNRSSFGLDRSTVLSPALRKLVVRAFEPGLTDLTARPTTGEWATKLYEGADMTFTCDECSASYFATENVCPWCRAQPPAALVASVHTQVASAGSSKPLTAPVKRAVVVQQGMAATISARSAAASADGRESAVASLRYGSSPGNQLTVTNHWDRPMWVVGPGGGPWLAVEPGQISAIPGSAGSATWELHFGSQYETHRLLRFSRLTQGGAR